jgi:hypothetical protein
LLDQVGDLFELNVKLRGQKVKFGARLLPLSSETFVLSVGKNNQLDATL